MCVCDLYLDLGRVNQCSFVVSPALDHVHVNASLFMLIIIIISTLSLYVTPRVLLPLVSGKTLAAAQLHYLTKINRMHKGAASKLKFMHILARLLVHSA